jgi:hypothetical protein
VIKNLLAAAAVLFLFITMTRAVPSGTALAVSSQRPRPRTASRNSTNPPLPRAASFHEVYGRGLLTNVWVNSAGPFTFAIDTGAGGTIVSPRVAAQAGVSISSGPGPSLAGMSGAVISAYYGSIQSLAVGDPDNRLPAGSEVIVSSGLPRDLDGLLDPNDAFGSFGYVIDVPQQELSAFDPRREPLSTRTQPPDGAVIEWLSEGGSHRPFVLLSTGERALIDTGSSLGFAVRDTSPNNGSWRGGTVRDVGGSVSYRRGGPRTISIGSLVLRNIPTDMVSGAAADAPIMLGLNALRPFRLAFDPLHRLIEIAPAYARR